jgi:hypothetical protein
VKHIILVFLLMTALAAAVLAQAKKIESVYTGLSEKNCKIVKEEFLSRSECPGTAGYKLEITDSGDRQDLNVIFPDGRRRELDFFNNASPAFSAFGENAEWLVRRVGQKITPFALILRFDINEEPEPQKIKSHLVVVKIAPGSACITDIVMPTVKNQNIEARMLAGNAAQKPCLAAAQIPKLIEQLSGKNDSEVEFAAAALVKIGPDVVPPLVESMKLTKFCDFQFEAAKVIIKVDKNHATLKPALFDIASGKCEYRYSPDKYLPDANVGGVIAQFFAAELLVSEIDGGIYLLPELKKDDGAASISALYAFKSVIMKFGNKNKADVKPEIIAALKATIPMLVKAVEKYDGRTRCDFYDVLRWMRDSGFEELRAEANRALEGKTVNCPK